MTPEQFLEGLNEAINKYYHRQPGFRHFDKKFIDTKYGHDQWFKRALNLLVNDYIVGEEFPQQQVVRPSKKKKKKKYGK